MTNLDKLKNRYEKLAQIIMFEYEKMINSDKDMQGLMKNVKFKSIDDMLLWNDECNNLFNMDLMEMEVENYTELCSSQPIIKDEIILNCAILRSAENNNSFTMPIILKTNKDKEKLNKYYTKNKKIVDNLVLNYNILDKLNSFGFKELKELKRRIEQLSRKKTM